MVKLRRFLCGCFGNFALLFLLVSFGTIPFALRLSHESGIESIRPTITPFEKIIVIAVTALATLVLAIPAVVAFLNGMAWWTVRKSKNSGRGWAIAASLSLILSSIPIALPLLGSRKYFSGGLFVDLIVVNVFMVALGITGIVAFSGETRWQTVLSILSNRRGLKVTEPAAFSTE